MGLREWDWGVQITPKNPIPSAPVAKNLNFLGMEAQKVVFLYQRLTAINPNVPKFGCYQPKLCQNWATITPPNPIPFHWQYINLISNGSEVQNVAFLVPAMPKLGQNPPKLCQNWARIPQTVPKLGQNSPKPPFALFLALLSPFFALFLPFFALLSPFFLPPPAFFASSCLFCPLSGCSFWLLGTLLAVLPCFCHRSQRISCM